MKKIYCLLLVVLMVQFASAQDTTVTLLDNGNKVATGVKATFIRKSWKQDTLWHALQYWVANRTLSMDAWFADSACKKRHGVSLHYHGNGMMADSATYINNKLNGERRTWDVEGNLITLMHYLYNITVDTCVKWYANGNIASIRVCNEAGNGIEQIRAEDGKKVLGAGLILEGDRNGEWNFKDENGVRSQQIIYDRNKIMSITCYDEQGGIQLGSSECVEKKVASFPGGVTEWRRYLERNLRYPPNAIREGIKGVVNCSFTVDKTGAIKDIKVLESPDKSLSEEAIRMLKASPKWEPAQQFNRLQASIATQRFTFMQ